MLLIKFLWTVTLINSFYLGIVAIINDLNTQKAIETFNISTSAARSIISLSGPAYQKQVRIWKITGSPYNLLKSHSATSTRMTRPVEAKEQLAVTSETQLCKLDTPGVRIRGKPQERIRSGPC